MKVKSASRWCLTADKTRAVPGDDPAGAFLLVGEGGEIEAAELERYGLLPDGSGYLASVEIAPASVPPSVPQAVVAGESVLEVEIARPNKRPRKEL